MLHKDRANELEKSLSSRLNKSKASIEDEFNKQSEELKSRAEKHEASKHRLEQVLLSSSHTEEDERN